MRRDFNFLLKSIYQKKLKGIKINRPGYVRRQVYSWYLQYKAGVAKPKDLLKWFGMLSPMDWCGLLSSIFDKRSWERLALMLQNRGGNAVKNIWSEATPLKEITNIKEFVGWISKRPVIENQTAK